VWEIDRAEVLAIVERTRSFLGPEEYATLQAFTDLNLWLLSELEAKETTLAKLRREVFGPSTEKTKAVFPDAEGGEPPPGPSGDDVGARAGAKTRKDDKPKPRGHGRHGADDYPGAIRVYTPHETLQHGSPCPQCHRGKTYRVKRPAVRIRVTGGAPLQATLGSFSQLFMMKGVRIIWQVTAALAYNLAQAFKLLLLPKHQRADQLKKLRLHWFHVAGRWVRTGRRWILYLARGPETSRAFERVQTLLAAT
jgi:hypothetical protein